MGFFWGIFLNVALVLVVLNGVIWLKTRRRPQPADERQMFGAVSTSFGGADFWSAALVVLINIVGGQVASAVASPGVVDSLAPDAAARATNMGFAWLIQGLVFGANWGVIAWRNRPFLDWKWSALAALSILIASVAVVIILAIVVS